MQAGSSKGHFITRAILLLPDKYIFGASTSGFFKAFTGLILATVTKAITHKCQLTEMLSAVNIGPLLFSLCPEYQYVPQTKWSQQSCRILLAKYEALKNMGGGSNPTGTSSQA